jgi:DNA processing protein
VDLERLREIASLVALLRSTEGSWSEVSARVESEGSAVRLLEQGAEQGTLLPVEGPDLQAAELEVEGWLDEGMTIITVLDEDYPSNLRTIHELPPILFIRGKLEPQDDRAIAVVGSRKASKEGKARAAEIAGELVRRDYTVASGLAVGIDTAAHRGALDAGGRTIAVIGSGLRHSYPPENAELQEQLANDSAVISQFFPHQHPTKWSFPLRNATMSGLANATVVVEAARKSGARMQARLACEHGRPVFLPRELVTSQDWAQEYAKWPNAFVVDSPSEIADRIDRLFSVETLTA